MTWHPVMRGRPYTPAEDAVLRRLYPSAPKADVLAALPGRSWHSIRMYAFRAKLIRSCGVAPERYYTTTELEALRRLYPSAPRAEVLAALPGRSWSSIALRAAKSGVRRAHPRPRWTREDLRRLREHSDGSARTLRRLFPGRPMHLIRQRLAAMGLVGRRNGIPQGFVALGVLARREQMEEKTLLRALREARGVRLRRSITHGHLYVDRDAARRALALWEKTRPRPVAYHARAFKVDPNGLRLALRAIGLRPPRPSPRGAARSWCVTREQVERALAARRDRAAGSLAAHARRLGANAALLRATLRAQGLRPLPSKGGRQERWRLSDAQVDLAVLRAGGPKLAGPARAARKTTTTTTTDRRRRRAA